MSCGVGHTWLKSKLLWLWRRPAATAVIQPLAWELPYAMVAALKSQKTPPPKKKFKKTRKKKKKKRKENSLDRRDGRESILRWGKKEKRKH